MCTTHKRQGLSAPTYRQVLYSAMKKYLMAPFFRSLPAVAGMDGVPHFNRCGCPTTMRLRYEIDSAMPAKA